MGKSLSPFGPLLIVLTAILWSLDGFLRTSLYTLPPILVSFWEHLLGLGLILPFFWRTRHELKKLTYADWGPVFFIGVIASSVAVILYTYALTQINFINFSIVVLLQQTQPIWAVLIAGLVLKEKITRHFLLLAAVAMAGVYLIVFPDMRPNLDTGTGTALAGFLALLAAASWGSATSFGKLILHKVSFGTLAFLRFSIAAVFSLLLFATFSAFQTLTGASDVFGRSHELSQFVSLTPEQMGALAMIVLITGAAAMLLYYRGLKHTPARVATICELAWPASSLIIGIVFFKNSFTVSQIIGIVILLGSMLVISRTQKDSAVPVEGEVVGAIGKK
ncbi:MAG: DMT family transporter [Patescibacteria group bacterium]|nr:DMT family transporter [Patescibacteria group bacterium]